MSSKEVIEGKIKWKMEVTRRRGRRRKKLLDDLKDRRGYSHLKEEALDRTMWRNNFGGGFGPFVRQNIELWWWFQPKLCIPYEKYSISFTHPKCISISCINFSFYFFPFLTADDTFFKITPTHLPLGTGKFTQDRIK